MANEQGIANAKRLLEKAIAEKGDPTGTRQRTLDKLNGVTGTTVAGTETAVPTTAETPNTGGRDYTKEAQTISQYGAPQNDKDLVDMAIMTYGDALPQEIQDIKDKLDAASGGDGTGLDGIGTSIQGFGQNVLDYQQDLNTQRGQIPGEMNLLQDLLKKKSGVGSQPLGKSKIFEMAGVDGIGSLSASLASNLQEMDMAYDSFANVVKRISDSKVGANTADLAKAENLLKSWEIVRDEYRYEKDRIDKIEERKQNLKDSMALADYQHNLDIDKMDREAELEAGSAVSWQSLFGGGVGTGSTYTSSDGTIYLAPGYSTAEGDRTVLGTQGQEGIFGSEFANNCVKYARLFVPNLPYGLWDISDKANAVDQNIGKDKGQAGYAMLTAEGAYGHATVVLKTDQENRRYYVREANYTPGTITEGRWISFDDPRILGFIAPDESKVGQTQGGAMLAGAQAGGKFSEDITNMLSVKYEGMNPTGAETYVPTTSYTNYDMATTYANALAGTGVKMTDQDAEVKQFIYGYLASGDYEGAKQQILNTAMNGFSADQKADTRSRIAIMSALVTAKNKIQAYKGDMGVFAGSIEDVANKLGTSSDPQLKDIGVSLSLIMDNYVRMQTGAAFTEDEQKYYEKLFPTTYSYKEFSIDNIDSLTGAINETNKSLLGSILGDENYEKIFSPQTLESERGWSDETAESTNQAMRDIFGIY